MSLTCFGQHSYSYIEIGRFFSSHSGIDPEGNGPVHPNYMYMFAYGPFSQNPLILKGSSFILFLVSPYFF